MAKRYTQQSGIDFNETYAPVIRLKTIKIILAHNIRLPFFHVDVKSTFQNKELQEETYIEQPRGHVIKISATIQNEN